jgi:lipopolysaccharide biosynthesis protein
LIPPVLDRYVSSAEGCDLFITTRHDLSESAIEEIRRRGRNVFIQCEENRGRDIRPFLFALRRIQAFGYKLACKIHTKKAPHLAPASGEQWRQRLMEPLLGSSGSVARVVQAFSEQPDLGLLAPEGSIMDLHWINANMFNTIWLNRLLNRMNRPDLIGNYSFHFPAGSMFWFRVAALSGLDEFILAEDEFEEECGQTDGTLAHAVERLVALFAEQRGYRMRGIS